MKSICYFGINDGKIKAFREDGEVIFSAARGNKPIAFINEQTWFDWKTHQPVAFEEDDIVYDWRTHQPVYFISIE